MFLFRKSAHLPIVFSPKSAIIHQAYIQTTSLPFRGFSLCCPFVTTIVAYCVACTLLSITVHFCVVLLTLLRSLHFYLVVKCCDITLPVLYFNLPLVANRFVPTPRVTSK